MPFVEFHVKEEIEKRRQNDEKFRKAWDRSRTEYAISLQKKRKHTRNSELVQNKSKKRRCLS